MCMSDEWFTEHVFQVVAPRNFVDKKLVDLFDNGTPSVLPRWVSSPPFPHVLSDPEILTFDCTITPRHRIRWALSPRAMPHHRVSISFLTRAVVPSFMSVIVVNRFSGGRAVLLRELVEHGLLCSH